MQHAGVKSKPAKSDTKITASSRESVGGGGGGGGGRKSTKLVNSLLSGPSLIKFSTLSAPTKVVIVVVENSIRNDDFLKKLKNALGYGLETFWKFK